MKYKLKEIDEELKASLSTMSFHSSVKDKLVDILSRRPINILADTIKNNLSDLDEYLPKSKLFVTQAASLISDAINNEVPILVYGDYDVDGITSTAVLVTALKLLKAKVSYKIPNRLSDGYGLDANTVITTHPTGLVITVDNGISLIEEVKILKDKGYQVIITDHHLPTVTTDGKLDLPDADVVLNPKCCSSETDNEYSYPGVMVAAILGAYLVDKIYNSKGYTDYNEYATVLSTLGIVSDVIDMNPHTMSITTRGLSLLRLGCTGIIGISKLIDLCRIKNNGPITTTMLAFLVIPKLNSAGRMGSADKAYELLTLTDTDDIRAIELSSELFAINKVRKSVEANMLDDARLTVENNTVFTHTNVVYEANNHPGVVGIVAARLVEEYNKPALVCYGGVTDKVKCSGRSVEGIDLHSVLKGIPYVECGGHAGAVGLSLEYSDMPKFMADFDQAIANTEVSLDKVYEIDGILTVKDLRMPALLAGFHAVEPVAKNNPVLRFLVQDITITNVQVRGDTTYIEATQDGLVLPLSRYKSPVDYKTFLDKKVDIIIETNFSYFNSTYPEHRILVMEESQGE